MDKPKQNPMPLFYRMVPHPKAELPSWLAENNGMLFFSAEKPGYMFAVFIAMSEAEQVMYARLCMENATSAIGYSKLVGRKFSVVVGFLATISGDEEALMKAKPETVVKNAADRIYSHLLNTKSND